jgi:hypothetical protein
MIRANGSLRFLFAVVFAVATMAGCVAVETRPTLDEARLARNQVATADDSTLRAGETRAELMEVIPSRGEIRVRTDDGRDRVMTYSTNRITVAYHGWDYTVENLQSGDIIAFQTDPRNSSHIESIRVQEPVQARTSPAPSSARPFPTSPRSNVIEGTVERIQYDRGIFGVRTRSGEVFTVSLPYSARAVDVESFRRLRTGDYVRLEGEFINRDNLQLDSFISPR